ncbi:MAG: type II toxin-antitoxin system Phd/YefM family antitoxin [Hyphomicrobiales bacterium]
MVKVTSAQLIKHFGRYHDAALREPVTVTKHGRDSVVILSADEYYRLKPEDLDLHPAVEEPAVDLLEPIEQADIPVELVEVDDDMQVWMP